MKKLLFITFALFLVLAAGYFLWQRSSSATPALSYVTAEVTRGDVRAVIRATGTIEPEDLIDVGAQVAGQILSFGTDIASNTVDYCSTVREGALLAKLDDVTYLADLRVSQAQLASATASVIRAHADILQLEARLQQASRDWARAQKLGVGEALAQTTYDNYQFASEIASANLEVGRAELKQAEAAVIQAQASVEKAERNLGYCTILSPVDGVIIDRRVNIGQTVVASLNAPSLFLIAKDLKRVEIWVAVNEADIGAIHAGMPVLFTVDALPGATFRGTVNKIRLNAAMTQNVVTYTVEVKTDNPDGHLLPYLTANIQFITGESTNTLLVPSAALRWQPDGGKPSLVREGDSSHVYLFDPATHAPRCIDVTVGITDGLHTEIRSPELRDGDHVITGKSAVAPATTAAESTSNPFMPKLPTPPKRGGPR